MRGADVNAAFLISPADWARVTKGTAHDAFHLGEVCGKHSDVSLPYSEIYWDPQIETDPYAIARLVAGHGSFQPWWIEQYLKEYESEAEE